MYSGLRIGELCALTWNDIDFENSVVHVSKTLQRIADDSKDSKTRLTITTPKSKTSIREIPLPSFVMDVLKQNKGCGYILSCSSKPVEPRTLQNRFKTVLKNCGIHNANFHLLRHTYATVCIESGFDAKTVSELLGHSNVNITLNRYENQLQLIKTSIEATNILRHDMNNHLSAVFSDVTNGNIQEAQKHLIDIIDGYKKGEDFICTGYSAIDSLINFKLQFAKNNGIKVNVTASIPSNLKITSFDSTVIIGNLLDNAVRAASSVSENGFISVVMRYSKGMLLIKISNSYIGAIKRENGYLITTKSDKANHGYGLKSVKEVVEKYNGSLEIETGENTFTTTAVMYID